MPSGNRYKARFRNSNLVSALTRAEQWTWSKKQILKTEGEISGKIFEFDIPPQLDRSYTSREVSLPVALWEDVESIAKANRVGISKWLEDLIKSNMERNPPQP